MGAVVTRAATSRSLEFPIRVVDVHETLKDDRRILFRAPQRWEDFHVISHTWSQMVRDLSKMMGGRAAAGWWWWRWRWWRWLCGRGWVISYEETFKEADLRNNSCYVELRKVLGWLAADGVNGVWMDALCINQTDEEEKSREIARMGNYYGKSQGCYVVPNGIGQPYSRLCSRPKVLDPERTDQDQVLPRWFYRVWTLQEYLLPRQLSFLVGDLPPAIVRLLNAYIECKNSDVGFCECCVVSPQELYSLVYRRFNAHLRNADAVQALRDDQVSQAFGIVEELIKEELGEAGTSSSSHEEALERIDDEYVLARSEVVCGVCGSKPLIRRASSSSQMYFVEPSAYHILLYFSGLTKWEDKLRISSTELCRMREELVHTGPMPKSFDSLEVMSVTGLRDCSNDEDRVLGILGLLRVEGIEQLRTQRTLEEQVVKVASHDHDFAFSVCILNEDSFFQVPGLSWASNLRDVSKYTINTRQDHPSYLQIVKIIGVSPQGLDLSSTAARGRLQYRAPLKGIVSGGWRLISVEGCPDTNSRIPDERQLLSSALKLDPPDSPISLLEFDIHLILLDSYTRPAHPSRRGSKPLPLVRVMLCTSGRSESEFHNLYNIFIPSSEIQAIATPIECRIGGHGKEIPRESLLNAHIEHK